MYFAHGHCNTLSYVYLKTKLGQNQSIGLKRAEGKMSKLKRFVSLQALIRAK
ncbi:hypothetical protein LguiB_009465 [Lonicera macranthoides]